jgi:hypothetical protein
MANTALGIVLEILVVALEQEGCRNDDQGKESVEVADAEGGQQAAPRRFMGLRARFRHPKYASGSSASSSSSSS